MTFLKGALAAALILSSSATSFAETAKSPLAAGKPAGVQSAAMEGRGLMIALGAGAIIAFTVSILTADKNGVTSPTTSSTTGTP